MSKLLGLEICSNFHQSYKPFRVDSSHHKDFSYFYDLNDSSASLAFERLEVRAFGCLLEDLLDRVRVPAAKAEKLRLDRLNKLRQDCLQPLPAARPRFKDIDRVLAEIATKEEIFNE